MNQLSPFGRGQRLLAAGRWAEGWPLYETRRQYMRPPPTPPQARQPEWQGEDLAGKSIIVCAEQGWGDQLMFGRYLSQLRERAGEVVVACHPFVIGRLFDQLGYATSPLFANRPIEDAD